MERPFAGGDFKRGLRASAAANFAAALSGVAVPIIPPSAPLPTLLRDIFICGPLSISGWIIDGLWGLF